LENSTKLTNARIFNLDVELYCFWMKKYIFIVIVSALNNYLREKKNMKKGTNINNPDEVIE